ncbi:MAG TPA: iron uptake transporter permease EfeU [Mycobacteriales bacterium]|nr:iron uptake transporter permease EfeU [Mycobacteriales bacterium]
MHWADAVPNLLIGLREGLEAGLVVSILLAAVHKLGGPDGERPSTAPIWLGVLGAVATAGSFAAVLTYSTSVLSSRGQEAVGGLLSVTAVALVTAMIFWMRRTAATLSGELRHRVQHAALLGAGALTVTAFVSVGREGLETTLFLWTAVRASGQTVSPLIGAAVGLLAAVVLCALLFRQAVRLNLGVFFSRTAIALIVIAAGVLSYGLGDLQEAGWLPGNQWVAFDVSNHVDPGSWWVSIVTGVTDLSTRMTVLQVVAWASYLTVVLPLFLRSARTQPVRQPAKPAEPGEQPAGPPARSRWAEISTSRTWPVAAALLVVPAAVAGIVVAALPTAAATSTTTVTVSRSSCAPEWHSGEVGTQTFSVTNNSGRSGEINLVNASGAVVAEIETIGPATTADMTATIGPGSYTIRCLMSGRSAMASGEVDVSGHSIGHATAAIRPVTIADLAPANHAYQAYVEHDLRTLSANVATLRSAIHRGDPDAMRVAWLRAQLTWERVGASYDSFGADGIAIDGLPDGLAGGAHDPDFTGLHRVEYDLWHGASRRELQSQTDTLAADVMTLRRHVQSDEIAGDPTNLPIRAHEILEDALRDHLSGIDDEGAGAAYAETYADTQVTSVVLDQLSAQITARAPRLVPQARTELQELQRALLATRDGDRWRPLSATPLLPRQRVDAAIGTVLQTLSRVPDLLEVPPSQS